MVWFIRFLAFFFFFKEITILLFFSSTSSNKWENQFKLKTLISKNMLLISVTSDSLSTYYIVCWKKYKKYKKSMSGLN